MTIKNRARIDATLKTASKVAKKIRKINKPFGTWLQDRVYDIWDKTYA